MTYVPSTQDLQTAGAAFAVVLGWEALRGTHYNAVTPNNQTTVDLPCLGPQTFCNNATPLADRGSVRRCTDRVLMCAVPTVVGVVTWWGVLWGTTSLWARL